MIGYVDVPPSIDLKGGHFLLTVTSGGEDQQFMLTTKAFYLLSARCSEAKAKRVLADLEAREKIVPFRKSKARKGEKA